MGELKMTEKISLNLTLEELEIIDKCVELTDSTRQLFDKIRKAYPKSPVEVAYKRVFGDYPPTTPSVSNYGDNRWIDFQSGYSCGYGDGLENSNNFAISKKIIDKPKEKQSKTLTDKDDIELYNPDEFIVNDIKMFHYEVMDSGKHVWAALYLDNGRIGHLNIFSDCDKLNVRYEEWNEMVC